MSEYLKPEIVFKASSARTSEVLKTSIEIENTTRKVEFSVILGDLTEVSADAIVCPANPGFEYAGFGGVQVAIAERAGMSTFEEAESKAKAYVASKPKDVSRDGKSVGVPLGYATATESGRLKQIKKIIHVNNMRTDKNLPPCDEDVVRLCTSSVLAVADAEDLGSVAIPAIGTGIWGMSLSDSIIGVIKGMKDFYKENPYAKVNKVGFVIYAKPSLENAKEMQEFLESQVYSKLKK